MSTARATDSKAASRNSDENVAAARPASDDDSVRAASDGHTAPATADNDPGVSTHPSAARAGALPDRQTDLIRRAEDLFPGGVNSPVRAFRSVGRAPLVLDAGDGARVRDA